MPFQHSVSLTIPISASVSSPAALIRGLSSFALVAPVVTSCQLFLQGGDSTTTTRRVWNTSGGSQFAWSLGPGSASLVIASVLDGFSHVVVETSVVQAAAVTFTLIGRPRA